MNGAQLPGGGIVAGTKPSLEYIANQHRHDRIAGTKDQRIRVKSSLFGKCGYMKTTKHYRYPPFPVMVGNGISTIGIGAIHLNEYNIRCVFVAGILCMFVNNFRLLALGEMSGKRGQSEGREKTVFNGAP